MNLKDLPGTIAGLRAPYLVLQYLRSLQSNEQQEFSHSPEILRCCPQNNVIDVIEIAVRDR